MKQLVLTDEEISNVFRKTNFETSAYGIIRNFESEILAKLPSLGYVKLGPTQVVAERRVIDSGEEGNWHYELFEVKPCA